MILLRFLLKYWLNQRYVAHRDRVKALERWHRIFNEWFQEGLQNWDEAVDMANQGLTYVDFILRQYYLPAVQEAINTRAILRGSDA